LRCDLSPEDCRSQTASRVASSALREVHNDPLKPERVVRPQWNPKLDAAIIPSQLKVGAPGLFDRDVEETSNRVN
jgi:hypothetical protein